jgi:hypothetical protein
MRNDPTPGSGGSSPAPARAEWGVHLGRVPAEGSREAHAVATRCAMGLQISLADALLLIHSAPVMLPRALHEHDAHQFAAGLERDGASARVKRHPHAGTSPCGAHPTLLNEGTCDGCGAWICLVCRAAAGGEARCPGCRGRKGHQRLLRRVRLALLLLALAGVGAWAWDLRHRRAERTEWTRTLNVAVFLLDDAPPAPEDVQALKARLPALGELLASEMGRYRDGAPRPFAFTAVGPLDVAGPPPTVDAGANLFDRARQAWALWSYLRGVHQRAGVDPDDFDARLYVLLRPAASETAPRFVEGEAEAGGEVGVVQAVLGRDTVDGVLIAAAHELLHLLGATDKYDAEGHARAPEGLAEPDRPFPQRYAEVMTGEIATAPSQGQAPWRLDQVRVGPATAAEIRWAP